MICNTTHAQLHIIIINVNGNFIIRNQVKSILLRYSARLSLFFATFFLLHSHNNAQVENQLSLCICAACSFFVAANSCSKHGKSKKNRL